jgi:hypothetical protein
MSLITEFEYVLTTPFGYDHAGERRDAEKIVLKAPSSRNSKQCAYLKQAFFQSLPEVDVSNPQAVDDAETTKIDGEAIMAMLAMSKNTDLAEVLEVARELFTSGIAMIDGQQKLTKHLTESMSQEDWESMLGAYMANFTVASALAKMNALSSKQ